MGSETVWRPMTSGELDQIVVADGVPVLAISSVLKHALPPLRTEEFQKLEASIIETGCLEPIVVWRRGPSTWLIVDGHNRYAICQKWRLPFKMVVAVFKTEADALDWILVHQFARRNMGELARRSVMALRIVDRINAGSQSSPIKVKKGEALRWAQKVFSLPPKEADLLYTHGSFLDKVRRLCGAEALRVFQDSEVYITESQMRTMRRLTESELKRCVGILRKNKDVAFSLTATMKERRKSVTLRKLEENKLQKQYVILVADPPWQYDFSTRISKEIDINYPTLGLMELLNMPVTLYAGPHSLLFLWCPAAKLQEGIEMIRGWGFTYLTCAAWQKTVGDNGSIFRVRHEMVLVGKRGKPPAPEGTKLDSIFTGPVDRDHSKKPETLQDWIDTAWPDMPKLELFARRKRPHWDVYGNEVEDSI